MAAIFNVLDIYDFWQLDSKEEAFTILMQALHKNSIFGVNGLEIDSNLTLNLIE